MLGDTAVAVHPDDERYKHLVGKHAILPLVGRRIPIIADDYSDPEKGTGAVKITPAHDFNDFEVGQRHKLPLINILDVNGDLRSRQRDFIDRPERCRTQTMALAASTASRRARRSSPSWKRGPARQDRAAHHHGAARRALEASSIEPCLTEQWYVERRRAGRAGDRGGREGRDQVRPRALGEDLFRLDATTSSPGASRASSGGAIRSRPGTGRTARSSSRRPSRALAEAASRQALRQASAALTRDEDVLDTWFSSALWPFSTLGWPDQTPELKRYYPTDVLVTGFDIIFFWVARMMMMGIHFMEEVPFHTVYIHALVRDEKGAEDVEDARATSSTRSS